MVTSAYGDYFGKLKSTDSNFILNQIGASLAYDECFQLDPVNFHKL